MLVGTVKANQIHSGVLVGNTEKREIACFSGFETGNIEFWELLVVIVQPKRKAAEWDRQEGVTLRSRGRPVLWFSCFRAGWSCTGSSPYLWDSFVM